MLGPGQVRSFPLLSAGLSFLRKQSSSPLLPVSLEAVSEHFSTLGSSGPYVLSKPGHAIPLVCF